MESTEIQGHGQTPNLRTGVAAKLLAFRESGAHLLPTAANHLVLAHLVAEQAKVSGNTSIVGFEDERIGNTKFFAEQSGRAERLRGLGIVEQELVEVIVAAVKGGQRIVGSKGNEFHSLPAPFNFNGGISDFLVQLAAVLGPLLLAHVLHLQSSHLEEASSPFSTGVSLIGLAIIMCIKVL